MNHEMLELLIGKFLDSEITPAEQRLLDDQLCQDPHAQRLLQEYSQLHDHARQALQEHLLEQGTPAREIFQRALAVHKGCRYHPLKTKPARSLQVAAFLAAGFMIGLFVYGVWLSGTSTPVEPRISPPAVVLNNPRVEDVHKQPVNNNPFLSPRIVDLNPFPADRFERRMDYFNYSDPSGAQYIIEAYRDKELQTATYNGGL